MSMYGHLLSLGIGMCWWPLLYPRHKAT
jgi:hypothetical protein